MRIDRKRKFKGFLFMLLFIIGGCHPNQHEAGHVDATIYTVKAFPWQQTLYFSGIVQPSKIIPIISPAEGTITKVGSLPAQQVKQGALLYVITTQLAEKQFQPALAGYLKDKKMLADAQEKKKNSVFLYKNGIISQQEYEKSLEDYYTAELTVTQSQQTFDQALQSLKIKTRKPALFKVISQLDLSHSDSIKEVLQEVRSMDCFEVYAPINGLLLLSTTRGEGNDSSEKTEKATMGSHVKKDQLLGQIGTKEGINVIIEVDEMDITKLHVGQRATVTMLTLPGERLSGMLTRIAMQADSQSGEPKFTATVLIPHLSDRVRSHLRFGVDAKIAVLIGGKKAIFVPIDAIDEDSGTMTVKKLLPNGQSNTVTIMTGVALQNRVRVVSGLKEGDKIIVPAD